MTELRLATNPVAAASWETRKGKLEEQGFYWPNGLARRFVDRPLFSRLGDAQLGVVANLVGRLFRGIVEGEQVQFVQIPVAGR